MVSEAIRKQLMPFVSLKYGSQGEVRLDERVLYVEHYQAYHEVCVCVCVCEVCRTIADGSRVSLHDDFYVATGDCPLQWAKVHVPTRL